MGPGKENVTPVISLSKADKKAFGQLRDMGADLFIQRIPNGKEEDVQLLFQ
jgi:mannose/fructose/N-acetylgalactosamine-specific phosphotransferase system component IIB